MIDKILNFTTPKKLGISLVLCTLFPGSVFAEPLPKWEFGIALGGQWLNDYRGSRESQLQAYPIQFFIYRGDFLKADRSGVRGEFFSSDAIELNVSAETALNGSADDNALREGMPELESTFEFGPSLNVNLSGDDFSEGWQLRLPLRVVVSAGESGVHYQGYTFNPRLTYTKPGLWGHWRAKANLGLLYGSDSYHDYFYTVEEQYVTDARPRYEADAGFSGYYFKSSISRAQGKFLYGVSFRYDNLQNTVFEDSPLVETTDYYSMSFVVAWVGWQSSP